MMNGSGSTIIHFEFVSETGSQYKYSKPWEGVYSRLQKTYTETSSDRTRSRLIACMNDEPCSACNGEKLNPAASMVTVGGKRLPEIGAASVHDALDIIKSMRVKEKAQKTAIEALSSVEIPRKLKGA